MIDSSIVDDRLVDCLMDDRLTGWLVRRPSQSGQPMDRVNRYLAQALVARSIEQERSNHVNFFTLRFKGDTKETQVMHTMHAFYFTGYPLLAGGLVGDWLT